MEGANKKEKEMARRDTRRPMLFPMKPAKRVYGELIARGKFEFREFDRSIGYRERVHRRSRGPYGSRAPSMEVMGHGYTKKTLSKGWTCFTAVPVTSRAKYVFSVHFGGSRNDRP